MHTHLRRMLPLLALAALGASPAAAQQVPARGAGLTDVELLGRIHGTRPPQAYYDLLARDPDAFTFDRAWKARNPRLRGEPGGDLPRFEVRASVRGPEAIGPREGAVTGTIRVPLVLGLFSDSEAQPPFTRERVQEEFFSGPNSRVQTITEYYSEISGGRLELLGETLPWRRSDLTQAQVSGGSSGLGGSARVGQFIMDILAAQTGVDWGQFDNDGPDGIPNSGDDDGYVDVLAVMHPTPGAECNGDRESDRIWSHKWSLRASVNQDFVTSTPAAVDTNGDGDVDGDDGIRISDYTVQPVFSCDGGTINEIGVLAHELGHGLGLPDLYDTSGDHNGIGRWGLMGSGAWGCSAGTPERPCHMNAWSKEQLGWAEVVTLSPDVDLDPLVLDPVESGGTIYRIDARDGSGEYFLLENRQRIGSDQSLPNAGLLIWQIDEPGVLDRWRWNGVNARTPMGVFLRQADGDDDLGARSGGNRGDGGDPYPGTTGNTEFHVASFPASRTWSGNASGLTLVDIARDGQQVTARLLTAERTVTLETSGDDTGAIGFDVDGAPVAPGAAVSAFPFERVEITAGAGAEISEGRRVGFDGWGDDASLERSRDFEVPLDDVTLTAIYGGTDVRALVDVEGSRFGVDPGSVAMSPAPLEIDGTFWFPEGTEVTFEAAAAEGFDFQGWTGVLEGRSNPTSFRMDDPAELGAVFDLTYAAPDASHAFEAAREQDLVLVADGGVAPVQWTLVSGSLPPGMQLLGAGRVTGAAEEMGGFTFTVRARDARGLEATGEVSLQVTAPEIGVVSLISAFVADGGALSLAEQRFLDRQGNANGFYDLGDLRAWVLTNPDLPATAQQRSLVRTLIPTIRFDPPNGGGR